MSNVIARATKALDLVSCSNKKYIIESPCMPLGPIPGEVEEMQLWPVREISSWGNMSLSNVTGVLLCLYPGVVREGESGQEEVQLVRPTLLGYKRPEFYPPQLPQSSRSPSPPREEATNRERDLPDTSTSRIHQRQPSSTQSSRTVDSKAQKTETTWFVDRLNNLIGNNNIPASIGRPLRRGSPLKRPQTSTSHPGRHFSSHIPVPEAYPTPDIPSQHGVDYFHATMDTSSPHAINPIIQEPGIPESPTRYRYDNPKPYEWEHPAALSRAVNNQERGRSNTWKRRRPPEMSSGGTMGGKDPQ